MDAQKIVNKLWSDCQDVWVKLENRQAPTVKINNRLKTTAGRAWYDLHMIDLSQELLTEHPEHFLMDTIPHEVAHLVAGIVYQDYGHGQGWKKVLSLMGWNTTRCHHLVNSLHEARKMK